MKSIYNRWAGVKAPFDFEIKFERAISVKLGVTLTFNSVSAPVTTQCCMEFLVAFANIHDDQISQLYPALFHPLWPHPN